MNLEQRQDQHRHVVVVEDRPEIGDVLRMGLEEFGHYRVSAVLSGDQAVRVFDADRPDLVLLDAILPGMSGMEVAVHAVRRDIPVLVMTGEAAMQARLSRAGWPHLCKPFHLKELIAAVQATMARHEENSRMIRASLDRMFEVSGDLQQVLDRLAELRRHTADVLARSRRLGDGDRGG
jgi:DNA-binding response OmpR family regulator